MKKAIAGICLSLLFASSALAKTTIDQLQIRIDQAKVVLDQIMSARTKRSRATFSARPHASRLSPAQIKGAFFVGAQHGEGVVTCRTASGWSAPVFISLTGGSIGFQIGGEVTDLILVAVNNNGMQNLLKDKFKIGADASVAVGPVGRAGEASTNVNATPSCSATRAKGLLAGIDLSGVTVSQNKSDTQLFYGAPEDFNTVLQGGVPVPAGAAAFVQDVAQIFAASTEGH